jgi:DNA-nicking Smr family endonuclease
MSSGGGRKGRRLSEDEHALWETVTRSVKPLRKRIVRPPQNGSIGEPAARPLPKKSVERHIPLNPLKAVSPPPLVVFDRRTKQKIARGRHDIDGRIDLHGYTQAEAYGALLRFLRTTQAKGGKLVLVITGKGMKDATERGVLRRQVPLWLALPEFREYVVGFDAAGAAHGGDGALYVMLRKLRSR